MKKNIRNYIIVFIIVTTILTSCGQELKYEPGRDTVAYFGDCTFEILHAPSFYSLYNHETKETIEERVYRYCEIESYIYVVGESGYTVVNYETGNVVQKRELKDLPKEQQEIFEDESDFAILSKK